MGFISKTHIGGNTDMTSDFTIGDATRYKAIIEGNTIKIKELQLFLNDWRTMKNNAEKWDMAYGGVYDDEMPFTPERISLVMNFVNDHFPDFDTPKEFEDMIIEYTDWETELGEAEDKLEAVKTWYNYIYNSPDVPLDDFRFPEDSMVRLKKILEDQSSGGTEDD